ncbi:MAG: AMP-binding protein, partial [bacterium]|nr:AMP-binding protein [bacterium]
NLLQMAAFSFDVFAGDLARALLHSGTLVVCPQEMRTDLHLLYRLIRKHRISLFEATPALLLPLMAYIYENRLPIDSLRLLILGSDICPITDFVRLVNRFGTKMRIINSYGVTEATIDSSYYEARGNATSFSTNVPIGKPLPNMKVYVLDEDSNLQPIGIPGELYIGGKSVARGYINQTELTHNRFLPNPFIPGGRLYRTGDRVKWLPDGNLEFLGRIDFQVKIRGFR